MAGGGCNKQKLNKSKSRKPVKPSLFVEGGLLSDWSPVVDSSSSKGKSHNNSGNHSKDQSGARFATGSRKLKVSGSNSRIVEPQKPKMNAIGYNYPQIDPLPDRGDDGDNNLDESDPHVLVDSKESKVVAYVDQTPVIESETVKYTYEYGASSEMEDSFHRGLGFCDEEEDPRVTDTSPFIELKEDSISDSSSSEEIETDIMEDNASDVETLSSPEKNSGFLSIGGMKLYTRDISDEEDDDEENIESSESGDSSSSSDSDSDSDIDEEIAKDCVEGIGESYKDANRYISDDKDAGDIYGVDIVKRLGGIALQDASREYGMKKPHSRKKSKAKSIKFGGATDDWSVVDDLMLVKDTRILYSQKKKHAAKLPQSWPSKAKKSNHSRRSPGEKKKQRQDTIALKRRERMISRGVDLEKISLKLEQMVQNGGDIMSFELMHSRDCSQVQRLASIYRLQSGSQGSGKRRFVTVTRTEHTDMPSSSDRICLEKLLGVDKEEADFTVNGKTAAKMASNRSKKASKGTTGLSPLDSRLAKCKTYSESSKKKKQDKDKTGTYAAQPVSFISCGTMASEPVAATVAVDDSKPKDGTALPSSYGAFEMHTTGFGSRMMAKMGYVDGGGLGKDGRGIAEPIQVIQRPKSLGLGAEAPEIADVDATPPHKPNRLMGQSSRHSESRGKSGNAQFRSFEKHTKGFGSKMMAKMGYVEGTGLGRDSQGIIDPLVASRLPKSRGLGAEG
ncbi:hypothetical protein L6452_21906 [Arctium lappa]|uniref:Uncharacterized protein n=1 Tax=Arctium lappa TaxID=4217 RepID=A0ACB9AXG8_ARCLA|nr:hypothetical protein L6452_21906 [Arctium lappa]